MENLSTLQYLLTFVGFFFAGLVVNLTPCVYPMLTVTTSIFRAKQTAGQKIGQSFYKAFAYFLGIVVMYSALGYFAASTGKLFGSILQNSWVLGAVGLMMFALALSMFGTFQLRVPSEILNRLSGLRKANYIGLFASGMFVGVFAAPCIGPPVLALLAAVADNGNPVFGLSAFFVFSLGLGLPYLLLGTFSGLISKLPKAGKWLIIVERLFGVILLGFSLFYLSLALQFNLSTNKSSMLWTPYSVQAQELSTQQHKPVVIDFYADWCLGCHELDQNVFSKPKVIERLSSVTTLRIDATNFDEENVQAVIDQYEVVGLPTVIFLDSQGQEVKQARVEGSGTVNEFLKSLDSISPSK